MNDTITLPDTIRRSCLITRFAGEEIYGHRMTIAEHHFEVASYVVYIIDQINGNGHELDVRVFETALRLALVHDIPEIITGDIPTPAKYAIESFKNVLTELETLVIEKVLPRHISKQFDFVEESDLNVAANIIVKCADIMAVTREIVDEQKRGNHINHDLKFVDDALTRLKTKYCLADENDYNLKVFEFGCTVINNFIGQIYI